MIQTLTLRFGDLWTAGDVNELHFLLISHLYYKGYDADSASKYKGERPERSLGEVRDVTNQGTSA